MKLTERGPHDDGHQIRLKTTGGDPDRIAGLVLLDDDNVLPTVKRSRMAMGDTVSWQLVVAESPEPLSVGMVVHAGGEVAQVPLNLRIGASLRRKTSWSQRSAVAHCGIADFSPTSLPLILLGPAVLCWLG
jgi:hypothetical protein